MKTGDQARQDGEARAVVRDAYGKIAEAGSRGCGAPSCCGGGPTTITDRIGYSPEELGALPEGADLGLGCGNPGALASIRPGETVLDLGSGAGIDAFLAARRTGPTGRVIGVDMTPAMLDRARANLAAYTQRSGLSNIEFRLGEIEHLPVADGTVDILISNCVINLSPDKPQVWREVFRVLKPGGRVAVSDLSLVSPLPEAVRASVVARVACIGGAVTMSETKAMVEAAGLAAIEMTTKPYPLDAVADLQDPVYREWIAALPPGRAPGDFVVSLAVVARKPGGVSSVRTIQVLGTGCPACRKLAETAERAARELRLEYRLVKVDDMTEILRFGVLATPALVVDGVTKAEGRVPGAAEMKALLA